MKSRIGVIGVLFLSALSHAAYEDQSCKGITLDGWKRDDKGWAMPSPGSRMIYVTSKEGKSEGNVYFVKTTAEAVKLLRKGQPDHMYLNRGETFETFATNNVSGKSQEEYMLISAYGQGPRPVIKGGINFGASSVTNLVVTGLNFKGDNDSYGIWSAGAKVFKNILFENIVVENFRTGASLQEAKDGTNIVIRRSQFLNNYGPGEKGHPQGIYLDHMSGVIIEDSLFDKNGYTDRDKNATVFNHNLYVMSTCKCFIFRNNVSARGSATGLQARAGGILENNLFLKNPLAVTYGLVNGGSVEGRKIPVGVSGNITGNVFYEQNDISSKLPRGNALTLGNIKTVLVKDNLVFNYTGTNKYLATVSMEADMGVGIHSTKFENFQVASKGTVQKSGKGYGPVIVQKDGSIKNAKGETLITSAESGIPDQAKTIAIGDTGIDMTGINTKTQTKTLQTFFGKSMSGDQAVDELVNRLKSLDRSNWDSKNSAAAVSAYLLKQD